jgi:hypothetical protein
MSFKEALKSQALQGDFNEQLTENNALGFARTRSAILDCNFKVTKYRSLDDSALRTDLVKMFAEDPELTLKWLFFARDIRGGLGERRLFRVMFREFLESEPKAAGLIRYIPEYGRWDDLLDIGAQKDVLDLIHRQICDDLAKMSAGQPVSLLGKWLPSVNTSSKESREYARKIAGHFGWTEKEYRKNLSQLRKHLKVIERSMTLGEWSEINYEYVPSRANILYRNAFLKHDEERRKAFLEKLEKGEAKINSAVNAPHEIVREYWNTLGDESSKADPALEELWKALPSYSMEKTICVVDGSDSMTCDIGYIPWVVAHALGIYFAGRLSGEFKDWYITFSANPIPVDMKKCKTLFAKLKLALSHSKPENTNIEKVFDLILTTAVKNKMSRDDMPGTVLVLSDMAFDCSCYDSNAANEYGGLRHKLFEEIGQRYAEAGYVMPKLVFWNIPSRAQGAIPMLENEMGVILISGFSVHTVKMVLTGKTDPYLALLDVLNGERYSKITLAGEAATEGGAGS